MQKEKKKENRRVVTNTDNHPTDNHPIEADSVRAILDKKAKGRKLSLVEKSQLDVYNTYCQANERRLMGITRWPVGRCLKEMDDKIFADRFFKVMSRVKKYGCWWERLIVKFHIPILMNFVYRSAINRENIENQERFLTTSSNEFTEHICVNDIFSELLEKVIQEGFSDIFGNEAKGWLEKRHCDPVIATDDDNERLFQVIKEELQWFLNSNLLSNFLKFKNAFGQAYIPNEWPFVKKSVLKFLSNKDEAIRSLSDASIRTIEDIKKRIFDDVVKIANTSGSSEIIPCFHIDYEKLVHKLSEISVQQKKHLDAVLLTEKLEK
jgi:hypothetical protein